MISKNGHMKSSLIFTYSSKQCKIHQLFWYILVTNVICGIIQTVTFVNKLGLTKKKLTLKRVVDVFTQNGEL